MMEKLIRAITLRLRLDIAETLIRWAIVIGLTAWAAWSVWTQ